ncbi:agmatine deiminase family protein [Halioxenophilus aromaticivorans]|uniref:Agmatine deiminase family protein n=1 Tax=Halioxenophilus aromaticivorans TaxID=1306992 RepID=A0AAV3U0R4_9ALTE
MSDYYMPAEWQAHNRCWMAWPSNESLWPGALSEAEKNYAAIANAIADFEPVVMLVRPDQHAQALALMAEQIAAEKIHLKPWALDDSWMRDFGPTFVINKRTGELAGVDWTFNGWGKFPHEQDQHLARKLLNELNLERFASPLVNEGGAIHVDGEGTIMLTRNVQLNGNRNPALAQSDVEYQLKQALGVEHFIWFDQGLAEDHTDGHVDQFACFTKPGHILALSTSDPSDPNYEILQTNLEVLRNSTDAKGNSFEITTIEQPPSEWANGERLGKSYINFYIANGGVVMPCYGLNNYDSAALETVKGCFPDRKVVAVDCSVLVLGGGNIHCVTQQEPALNG